MVSCGQKYRWYRDVLQASLCVLVWCAAMPQSASARALAEIRQSGELRACMVAAHPTTAVAEPTSCRSNCRFSGPVYEQVLAFSKVFGSGVKVRFLRIDWDEQFFGKDGKTVRDAAYTPVLLGAGKCDFYAGAITVNPWRLKKLDIVVLHPSRTMVVVSRAMATQIKSLPNLAGKTAAVGKNTSHHSWLDEQNRTSFSANPVKVVVMSSTAISLEAVEAGKIDFTLLDAHMAMWATRHELKNAKTGFVVGLPEEVGWGFRKDDKDLQATAQQFFDAQRKDPDSELNQIWQKHFGNTLIEFTSLMVSVN